MAIYVFTLESFHIENTRALHNDTDVVSIAAGFGPGGDQFPARGATVSNFVKRVGDVNNGNHSVGLSAATGGGPNSMISFAYQIMNSGYDASNEATGLKVTNSISSATDKLLTGIFGYGAVWDAIDKATDWLNALIFVDCDGKVAGDAIVKKGQEWDALIDPTGVHRETRFYPGTDSAVGCGSNSKYHVTWSVTKTTDQGITKQVNDKIDLLHNTGPTHFDR
jgi:hypothetical protein